MARRKKLKNFSVGGTIIKCIPTEIKQRENPIGEFNFLNNSSSDNTTTTSYYTMTFKDTTGKTFTLNRKTKDQIVEYLKDQGYIMPGYGAAESLNAIIMAFREDNKLEIDNSISTMGIYWVNGKL